MKTIREYISAAGVGPIVLLVVGLFWRRFRLPLLLAGTVWGLLNVLLAFRRLDVQATVTVGDGVEVTYKPDDTADVADPVEQLDTN